jgi:hypothetical protein
MQPSRIIRKYSVLVACAFLISANLGAQMLLDSIVTYAYTSDRDSANTHKIANEYNGAGQLTSNSIYYWNTDTNRWEGWQFACEECSSYRGRYEYSYDEKGYLVSTSSFYWDIFKHEWVKGNTGRTEDGYDDRGNNVSIIYSIWNAAKNEWDPYLGYEFAYDEAGRIICKTTYDTYPTPQIWHPLQKILYTFDGKGRSTQEITQRWNDTARDWANERKTEWYYDSVDIRSEYSYFSWKRPGTNYTWVEDERHRIYNEYDQAGNRVLASETVRTPSMAWVPFKKEEWAYNSSGQMVLSLISNYQSPGKWTEDFRSEWVYNTEGRLILETLTGAQVRWPGGMPLRRMARTIRSLDFNGNTTRVIWFYWDAVTKSYLFISTDYYFYHSTSTGYQETMNVPIQVYPNPTSGILHLSGLSQPTEVKIYSMQGMLLRSINHAGVSVDISDLSPGAYLILISASGHPPFRTMLIKQ